MLFLFVASIFKEIVENGEQGFMVSPQNGRSVSYEIGFNNSKPV